MKGLSGRPVFILGSSRSGTTLVYSIVLSSGEFALYEAETHMMVKYAVKYGNIRNKALSNYQMLMLRLLERFPLLQQLVNIWRLIVE